MSSKQSAPGDGSAMVARLKALPLLCMPPLVSSKKIMELIPN
jgi:hypothetical protein